MINLSSDNEAVHLSKSQIIVNEADAERHIAKYELEVWGEGEGQEAMITAECQQHIALLQASVSSIEDPHKEPTGMFSEPTFDYDPDPPLRTAYSAETGKIIVYVNFPSVFHYLGEGCRYKKTIAAQVFIADLVAERCFFEIARKRVVNDPLIRPDSKDAKIQRYTYDFSKKYGRRIHEALVDQTQLSKSKFMIEEGVKVSAN